MTSTVFALDPMLVDVDVGDVLTVLLKVAVAFGLLLVAVMLMIWYERKLIAKMQNRIGPNVAGPWGILQTLADGIKLFFKEDLGPSAAIVSYSSWRLLSLVPLLDVRGHPHRRQLPQRWRSGEGLRRSHFLQVVDAPMECSSSCHVVDCVYGVMLAGWSRAPSTVVGIGPRVGTDGFVRSRARFSAGSVSSRPQLVDPDIVAGQVGNIIDWNVVQTWGVPFIIFWIAGTAELNRPPFDLVEANRSSSVDSQPSTARFASRCSTWPSS